MRILRTFCVFFMVAFSVDAFAQHCGTVEYMRHLESKHPGILDHMDEVYFDAIEQTQHQSFYKQAALDTTFTIDVVFHVVYLQSFQNVADSLIIEQLQVLNDAFNRTNADTANTREIFKPVAGNARIKFRLATKDPNGNPTTGITRTQTNRVTFNNNGTATQTDYVKRSTYGGHDAWDTKKYLNIWICNLNLQNNSRALFGYAYPPVGADFWGSEYYKSDPLQGVVLHYETIGTNNPSNLNNNLYTNEKTAIHEVGHYLGLRHTWGDARWGQDGCSVDDYIFDTPNTRSRASGCNLNSNTCNNDALPDQVENYMDYASSRCTNMFTRRQVDVMRYNLFTLRSELPASEYEYPERLVAEGTYVYPNPIIDNWSIAFDEPSGDEINVKLYDMLGREVYSENVLANSFTVPLNPMYLAIGMYRVVATDSNGEVIVKTNVLKAE